MKAFNIDIEAVEAIAYAAGMASIRAKVSITAEELPGTSASQLHMSEATLRRIHEGIGKILANKEKYGADITMTTEFPSAAR